MAFIYLFIFILGLAVGSFLNVCIYRIPRRGAIVSLPFHCINCGERIRLLVALKGRCRDCGERVSPRYLLVEVLTGTLYTVLFYKYGFSVEFAACIFLTSILIVVFFIDIDYMIIPDQTVIAGLLGGMVLFVYNLFYPFVLFGDRLWWNPLISAFLGSGFLLVAANIGQRIFKTNESVGGGDVKILIPIGMFLGWKLLVVALFLSVALGGLASVILVAAKVIHRRSAIPFGPFIVTGTFVTLVWGWDILSWYLKML